MQCQKCRQNNLIIGNVNNIKIIQKGFIFMTVKELKKILGNYPLEADVIISVRLPETDAMSDIFEVSYVNEDECNALILQG